MENIYKLITESLELLSKPNAHEMLSFHYDYYTSEGQEAVSIIEKYNLITCRGNWNDNVCDITPNGRKALKEGVKNYIDNIEYPYRINNRKTVRIKVLNALYEKTNGALNHWFDLKAVSEEIGIINGEFEQAYQYLINKNLIRQMGQGYTCFLTQEGLDLIEGEQDNKNIVMPISTTYIDNSNKSTYFHGNIEKSNIQVQGGDNNKAKISKEKGFVEQAVDWIKSLFIGGTGIFIGWILIDYFAK